MPAATPTIPRLLDVRALVERKSCFLFGPRQTGKSTLIGQQFADCPTWNLLDQALFRRPVAEPGADPGIGRTRSCSRGTSSCRRIRTRGR